MQKHNNTQRLEEGSPTLSIVTWRKITRC